MMRLISSATLSAAVILSGCSGLPQKIDHQYEQSASKISELVNDVGHTAPGVVGKPIPTVIHDNGIWLGKNVVKVGQPALPPIFYEPATFNTTVTSLPELAERITLRSGIPTKVSPDALAASYSTLHGGGGGGGGGATHGGAASTSGNGALKLPPLPLGNPGGGSSGSIGGMSSRSSGPVRIAYSNGDFKGLLDTTSARFGVYWKYVNGTVQFYHTDSRTFQISAIPGDSTFTANVTSGSSSTGGASSGSGGSSGGSGSSASGVDSNNSQNTAVSSQLSVYSSIEKSIASMLSSYGKAVASPATGTITVVDTPDSLDRVATFLENENRSLSRQVTINVTVLTVTLSNSDEYGINWNLVYSGLLNRYGIQNSVAASPGATGFSVGVLNTANSKFAGSSVIINALSQQGKVRRNTTASVVTLNNQPVPVQVATQTSYLKSSQTTNTGLTGTTTTLTPGMITAGFNMSILPHVLNNGTVMLQFSTDISALRGIRTVTSNGSSIESPELDTRNFLQRVAMKSNETLIISGYEANDDNIDKQGVGRPNNYLFGGGYNGKSNKEVIVILITPTTTSGS
jgi:type IVB pilus formation R64 PilN family outer membrane protein